MLERAYENSFLKIAAFEGKQLIGMVRVVGDGASVILIQDLLVRPEYQRKGIGSQLLRCILATSSSCTPLAGQSAPMVDCRWSPSCTGRS